MSIADKLTLIAQNELRVYDAGYASGYEASLTECNAKHYVDVIIPKTDVAELSLKLPFFPDTITIMNLTKGSRDMVACEGIKILSFSPTTSDIVGLHMYNTAGGSANRASGIYPPTSKGMSLLKKNENGTYSLEAGASGGVTLMFKGGCKHLVCAARYDNLSDAEKLETFVKGLNDVGGTAYVSQIMVDNAFGSKQWETLIATKSQWEFVMK